MAVGDFLCWPLYVLTTHGFRGSGEVSYLISHIVPRQEIGAKVFDVRRADGHSYPARLSAPSIRYHHIILYTAIAETHRIDNVFTNRYNTTLLPHWYYSLWFCSRRVTRRDILYWIRWTDIFYTVYRIISYYYNNKCTFHNIYYNRLTIVWLLFSTQQLYKYSYKLKAYLFYF